MENIQHFRKGRTCIVTTHRPSVLSICQRAYLIQNQAVVILQRGAENRVSAAEGMSLLSHGVYPTWDCAATETMLSLLDRFLEQIPVLRLECTPDAAAVDVLYQALERLPL